MTAELAVRATAARAVLGDYQRERDAWIGDTAPRPDWMVWALRLSIELAGVLDIIGEQRPEAGDAARLAEIREVLAHFDWEFHDRQLALERIDQIAGSGL